MTGPEAALAACRLAQASGAMLLWGGLGYLAVLAPPAAADAIALRLRSLWPAAVGLASLATLATLPIETAGIGSGWPDALSARTLYAVLSRTGVGHAWQAEVLAVVVLSAASLAQASTQQLRLRGAVASAAGLLLATFAVTGHAGMRDGGLGLAQRANAVVHVLAAGAWFGALVPLLPTLSLLDGPHAREAGIALRRFSTAGHAAVALVLASGAVNTALIAGGWPLDPASPYRMLLLLKVAVVALMVGLAILNRYRIVPRLGRDRARALATIRRVTWVEIALGSSALALVATFGLLDPA